MFANRWQCLLVLSTIYQFNLKIFKTSHNCFIFICWNLYKANFFLDVDSLPTLNTLQTALLNLDEKCEEELLSVVHHLLVCAIDDPGVPHNPEVCIICYTNLLLLSTV